VLVTATVDVVECESVSVVVATVQTNVPVTSTAVSFAGDVRKQYAVDVTERSSVPVATTTEETHIPQHQPWP